MNNGNCLSLLEAGVFGDADACDELAIAPIVNHEVEERFLLTVVSAICVRLASNFCAAY